MLNLYDYPWIESGKKTNNENVQQEICICKMYDNYYYCL